LIKFHFVILSRFSRRAEGRLWWFCWKLEVKDYQKDGEASTGAFTPLKELLPSLPLPRVRDTIPIDF
jgi:hypothetical protein